MKFYELEPEVAGGFGDKSAMDTSVHPPVVDRLHILVEGWLGDHLLETFPCFIVTRQLGNDLERSRLSGYNLDHVEIEKSDQFVEIYGDREFPACYWLKVTGEPGVSDFGISDQLKLIVSGQALDVMKNRLNHCEIKPWNG